MAHYQPPDFIKPSSFNLAQHIKDQEAGELKTWVYTTSWGLVFLGLINTVISIMVVVAIKENKPIDFLDLTADLSIFLIIVAAIVSIVGIVAFFRVRHIFQDREDAAIAKFEHTRHEEFHPHGEQHHQQQQQQQQHHQVYMPPPNPHSIINFHRPVQNSRTNRHLLPPFPSKRQNTTSPYPNRNPEQRKQQIQKQQEQREEQEQYRQHVRQFTQAQRQHQQQFEQRTVPPPSQYMHDGLQFVSNTG